MNFLPFTNIYIRNIVEPLMMMFKQLLVILVGNNTHFAVNIETSQPVQKTLTAVTSDQNSKKMLLFTLDCV